MAGRSMHKGKHKQHKPGDPWGKTEDIEHWVELMYGWALQVNGAIHALERGASKPDNPDDPPEPPWDA